MELQDTGEVAGTRYILEGPIGRGGNAEVFKAHDTRLNRWVAIKRLHPDAEGGPDRTDKVIREARLLASVQHPNVVTIYDCAEDGNDVLVVMELLHGKTLQEICEVAPLIPEDFAELARQTLDGLTASHSRGMLHRDMKPSNLMLCEGPRGKMQIKLLDFGLAKTTSQPSAQTVLHDGSLLGSIYTMAPEQFEGRELDARTDLYSLGCTFYFTLASQYPFTGASMPEIICAHLQQRMHRLHKLRPDLPRPVCNWVGRLMSLSPEDRPASALDALEELRVALAEPWVPQDDEDEIEEADATSDKLPLRPAALQPAVAPPLPKSWGLTARIVLLALIAIGVFCTIKARPAKPAQAPSIPSVSAPAQ